MRKRVLILCNYSGGYAAGQRFRFEQYFEILRNAGIEVDVAPFFDTWVWQILYKPGNTHWKIWAVLFGVARRLSLVPTVRRYDYVFIHLEAIPLGPPVMEWILFALGCKVVYDIDDAIFISRTSAVNRLAAPLRWRSKVPYVTRRSARVAACNPFLVDWARQYNENVVLLPTTIDPVYHQRSAERTPHTRPIIGWTGSRSNLSYLNIVMPALLKLQETHDFEFRVICDTPPPPPPLKNYVFVPWRLETEIKDLEQLDIGVMPVPDGLWEKGKVGFKAIQYAALEMVCVASNVASGPEVVQDGRTGFLIGNTDEEWYRSLRWLLDNRDRWNEFGAAARAHILTRYSVPSQAPTYIGLFK